jgi:hypothetical protein
MVMLQKGPHALTKPRVVRMPQSKNFSQYLCPKLDHSLYSDAVVTSELFPERLPENNLILKKMQEIKSKSRFSIGINNGHFGQGSALTPSEPRTCLWGFQSKMFRKGREK